MSIIGILSSNLFAAGAAHHTQSSQNHPSNFLQIKAEPPAPLRRRVPAA